MASGNEDEVALEIETKARVTRSAKSAATGTRVTRRSKQAEMEEIIQLKEVTEISDENQSVTELESGENSNGMLQTGNSESQDVDECSNTSNQGSLLHTTDVEDLDDLPAEIFEFNPDIASGDNAISFEGDESESIPNEIQMDSRQVNSEESILNEIQTEASQEKSVESENEVKHESSEVKLKESIINRIQADTSQVKSDESVLCEVRAEQTQLRSEESYIKEVTAEATQVKSGESVVDNVQMETSDVKLVLENQEDVEMVPEKSNDEGLSEHTEVVSEDELPSMEKPEVEDAENVSDDELPGPRPADLPDDTEVVSEDELPSVKKEEAGSGSAVLSCNGRKRKQEEGYDPGSPTSENETSAKKQAVAKNSDSKPAGIEKRPSVEEKPKKKVLPDLDKYWKTVNEDPSDFTGWTYLLQYVDQESDVDAAREAYDAFLSHYPYCYGYWRKYADYEKRKGSKKKCLEVLERGLRSIPLSVDLWIHYLNHIKTTRPDDKEYVRAQYERAIDACGLEFRSDRLWESYIKWETEHGTLLNVTAIYDTLLATPTLGYTTHFDNFQEHIMSHAANACVPVADFVRLRGEVREGCTGMIEPDADIPPGEEEGDEHMRSDEEGASIKERIIAARRKIHKANVDQVMQRWAFEEGIKRPYFHVKPLEKCQLKNWKSYLDWEQQNGDLKRTLVLHERCLIACALYEEFWLRLIRYLEEQCEVDSSLVGRTREVLERACSVHHLDKPLLHLHWAYFEERNGNAAKSADILERLEKTCPNLLQIAFRRINLERRRGDLDKCSQLYEQYIAAAKSKSVASWLSSKYSRFLQRSRADGTGAAKVLAEAVARDSLCSRLYLQQLDLALQAPDVNYDTVGEFLEAYTSQEGADPETKLQFAGRLAELAEELGSSAEAAQRAADLHRTATRAARKQRRKQAALTPTSNNDSNKKKETPAPPPGPPVNQSGAGSGVAPGGPGGYGGYGAGGGYYGAAPHPPQQGYEGYQQASNVGGYQPWPPAPTQGPGPGPYQQHPPGPGAYQQHAWPHSQYPNYY